MGAGRVGRPRKMGKSLSFLFLEKRGIFTGAGQLKGVKGASSGPPSGRTMCSFWGLGSKMGTKLRGKSATFRARKIFSWASEKAYFFAREN